MSGMPQQYRLYQDLAAWWPLISPPVEYTAEAAYLRALLAAGPGPGAEVLDLGSGGGNVAAHLKPGGCALVLLSSFGDGAAFVRELAQQGFSVTPFARRRYVGEHVVIFRAVPR